ncbi:hypothetical protein V2G26_000699 [Clonostachys chloroleuca]
MGLKTPAQDTESSSEAYDIRVFFPKTYQGAVINYIYNSSSLYYGEALSLAYQNLQNIRLEQDSDQILKFSMALDLCDICIEQLRYPEAEELLKTSTLGQGADLGPKDVRTLQPRYRLAILYSATASVRLQSSMNELFQLQTGYLSQGIS